MNRPPLRFKKVLNAKRQSVAGLLGTRKIHLHGAVAVILDGLDLDLSPTHDKLRAQDMRADVGSMGSGETPDCAAIYGNTAVFSFNL